MTAEQSMGAGESKRAPLVSVIMSNFNGADYLEAAVASVLGQSHRTIELIVADDASQDDSLAILRRLAASDDRLKLILQENNTGPAGARNAALDAARGVWVAIVDADDLIHPRRIERLLAAAEALEADVVADDLVSFGSVEMAGRTLLESRRLAEPLLLTAAELIRSDTVNSGLGSFGYLKPMIRRDALGPLRYDDSLRVGEDFDLYARLLICGARFLVLPAPLYLYRRHGGSISHRLSVPVLHRLLQAHDAVAGPAAQGQPGDSDLASAFRARRAALSRALRYERLVRAIKTQKGMEVARRVVRDPVLLVDLAASLVDRLRRKRSKGAATGGTEAQTLVLAAPDQVDLIAAPAGAVRCAVSVVDSLLDADWAKQRSLASTLARLSSQAPPDVIAEGQAGLEGLGYLPAWRSARLTLDPHTAREAIIPPGVEVEVSAELD
ncbi:glycosyltransferase family 2 protein [uncultured Roseobacter sp.]|uniref:glycosyltransferase family 2 protein n=1 Tax=uncultured Roseobacter sp. TaxID=114847 RepID=UPI0026150C26|nr:glycosyltransferase family 2 protein [uncultured Roseobacter sp.]